MTECSTREFDFQALGSRDVTARFAGGAITSDAGGLVLTSNGPPVGWILGVASLKVCAELVPTGEKRSEFPTNGYGAPLRIADPPVFGSVRARSRPPLRQRLLRRRVVRNAG